MSWTVTINAVSLVEADNKTTGVQVSYEVRDDDNSSLMVQGNVIGSDKPSIITQIKVAVQTEKDQRTKLDATLAEFVLGETFSIP